MGEHLYKLFTGWTENLGDMRGRMLLAFVVLIVLVCAGTAGAATIQIGGGGPTGASRCSALPLRTLVIVSLRTGAADCAFPDPGLTGCPQSIAVVANGHGGWFVNCGHDGLEELDSSGIRVRGWQTHLPNVPADPGADHVTALALVGDRLFVGGLFGVEALDASTGARVWFRRVTPSRGRPLLPSAGVDALAVDATAVFAGGSFVAADGSHDRPLVALDPRTGRLLSWRAARLGPPATDPHALPDIDALALDGARLYVAGWDLGSVGGSPRDGLAALNTATGRLLPWRPRAPGRGDALAEISGLLATRGRVYASGADNTNSTPGVVSEATGVIAAAPSPCQVICVVAGDVLYAANGVYAQDTLDATNLATGRTVAWAPYINVDEQIGGMAISGDRMLVVGTFTKTLG